MVYVCVVWLKEDWTKDRGKRVILNSYFIERIFHKRFIGVEIALVVSHRSHTTCKSFSSGSYTPIISTLLPILMITEVLHHRGWFLPLWMYHYLKVYWLVWLNLYQILVLLSSTPPSECNSLDGVMASFYNTSPCWNISTLKSVMYPSLLWTF